LFKNVQGDSWGQTIGNNLSSLVKWRSAKKKSIFNEKVKIHSETKQFLGLNSQAKICCFGYMEVISKMLPPRISPQIVNQNDNCQIDEIYMLVGYQSKNKNIKKPHSFKGAATNIPNY